MPEFTESPQSNICENVARIREIIAESCRTARRDADDVRLVAVTKYVRAELIDALQVAGVTDIGESRVTQLVERADRIGVRAGLIWHMIGHLQRNKVKPLMPHVGVIHSLDSLRLGEEIQKRAAALDARVDVFIEVNVAGERSKTGIASDQTAALAEPLEAMANLRVCGLMTMAPRVPDAEQARPYFARLRELLASLHCGGVVSEDCRHLSMGMSGDYSVAVEEGATLVRIGSALFEGLQAYDLRPERAG